MIVCPNSRFEVAHSLMSAAKELGVMTGTIVVGTKKIGAWRNFLISDNFPASNGGDITAHVRIETISELRFRTEKLESNSSAHCLDKAYAFDLFEAFFALTDERWISFPLPCRANSARSKGSAILELHKELVGALRSRCAFPARFKIMNEEGIES